MDKLNPVDSLSAHQLQLFSAGLVGLTTDEIRKAKSLYIRNAISEYKAYREQVAGLRFVQVAFAIIPFFWPILYAQHRSIRAQEVLFRERINNALDVWHDDLAGEQIELPD